MPDRTVVLLRHGRSRADDEGVHEGRYDSPLTATGREQADALGRYWQRKPPGFERIVCSTLARAHETAIIVGAALGLSVEPTDAWMEFDNGPFAGLPPEEVEARYPSPAFRSRWAPLTEDGGESAASLHRRADAAIELLLAGPGDKLLVVAHGNILGCAMRILLGASRTSHFHFGDTAFAELLLPACTDDVHLVASGQAPHLT